MKKYLLICLTVILAAFTFSSCGPTDAEVQGNAKQVLLMTAPSTDCTVRNGIVTITGTVESEAIKTELETKVAELDGVKRVYNDVQVVEPAPVLSEDDTLRAAVIMAIEEAKFKDVDVMVKDKVVTLKGKFSKADQNKIVAAAKTIDVAKVVNEMTTK
ncbi:BON domain-containing protein [Dysgonomonas sp. 25]|uniref:BON domain-containing protein n=1 Tax=Dysgonomonas sp. 25 TaxID=2302933 RepID=UPI0013D4C2A5|nr:BON domain-containing protein [Dysgonomonas sp. 25]NDV69198.1 BON domain-containing protein [Dysgonomonas sp. 25]